MNLSSKQRRGIAHLAQKGRVDLTESFCGVVGVYGVARSECLLDALWSPSKIPELKPRNLSQQTVAPVPDRIRFLMRRRDHKTPRDYDD